MVVIIVNTPPCFCAVVADGVGESWEGFAVGAAVVLGTVVCRVLVGAVLRGAVVDGELVATLDVAGGEEQPIAVIAAKTAIKTSSLRFFISSPFGHR